MFEHFDRLSDELCSLIERYGITMTDVPERLKERVLKKVGDEAAAELDLILKPLPANVTRPLRSKAGSRITQEIFDKVVEDTLKIEGFNAESAKKVTEIWARAFNNKLSEPPKPQENVEIRPIQPSAAQVPLSERTTSAVKTVEAPVKPAPVKTAEPAAKPLSERFTVETPTRPADTAKSSKGRIVTQPVMPFAAPASTPAPIPTSAPKADVTQAKHSVEKAEKKSEDEIVITAEDMSVSLDDFTITASDFDTVELDNAAPQASQTVNTGSKKTKRSYATSSIAVTPIPGAVMPKRSGGSSPRNKGKSIEEAFAAIRSDNPKLGSKIMMELAHDGNTEAQYHLAELYLNGVGVAQNRETAIYWLKKASIRNPKAYQRLATMNRGKVSANFNNYFIVFWIFMLFVSLAGGC